MQGCIVLGVLLATSAAGAQEVPGGPMPEKMIGMYVHQHWAYKHPYAARTWTLEDWRGYADGLHRLGYNTVMIWPVLETVPEPPTPSDRANIEKIAQVIDLLHNEFGMKALLTISPNAAAKSDVAAKYTFEERPFFYCDFRVDPGDAVALGRMIAWREELLRPLARMDGLVIIDSDPGGYPGSTALEFVYLLSAHRKMLDRLRPGIELTYWIHVGWEAYCRYYATAEFAMGPDEEIADTVRLLAAQHPEPWGLTGGRLPAIIAMGQGGRMFSFPYGAIEGEPSFPMTNFGGDGAYNTGKSPGPRGIMGNAQTHCVQLPNTFAFARGAQGLPCAEADYLQFAQDLLPGHGETILAAWRALSGVDAAQMAEAKSKLAAMAAGPLTPGPLKGLLLGEPQRFVNDLLMQLDLRATLEAFHAAVFAEPLDKAQTAASLAAFVAAAEAWQGQHGYKNNWYWPRMEEALRKLDNKDVNKALDARDYTGEGSTPFEKVQSGFYQVETYTPGLIDAMKRALGTLR